jgi:hypothetical protein
MVSYEEKPYVFLMKCAQAERGAEIKLTDKDKRPFNGLPVGSHRLHPFYSYEYECQLAQFFETADSHSCQLVNIYRRIKINVLLMGPDGSDFSGSKFSNGNFNQRD